MTLFAGCGGSGQNKNVAENADAKAIADYEAEEKARARGDEGQSTKQLIGLRAFL